MTRASPSGGVPPTTNRFAASMSSSSPTADDHERDVVRERLRIWTSDPPRSKCTSSMYAFIGWMPCPCPSAESDVGEMACITLGILESISKMEERERFPGNGG